MLPIASEARHGAGTRHRGHERHRAVIPRSYDRNYPRNCRRHKHGVCRLNVMTPNRCAGPPQRDIRHLRQLLQRIAHQHLLIIASISPATSHSQYRAQTDDAASIRRSRLQNARGRFHMSFPCVRRRSKSSRPAPFPRRHFLQQRLFNIQNAADAAVGP